MEKLVIHEGYKQTEIGVIPDDWDIASIGDIASVIDPQPDHRTPPEDVNGAPYIGISDFNKSGGVDWINARKVIPKAVEKQNSSFEVCYQDIIFGKIGTIGKPKYVPKVTFKYALSANVLLIKPKISPVYLMNFFLSDIFNTFLNSELHSTSQAAFGIHKMRKALLPVPPIEEQTAIANALSDVDALIAGLEKLIAKKQAIKTATMQQLLTGRTRLPEFADHPDGTLKGYKQTELGEIPEDWDVKAIKDFAPLQRGFDLPSTRRIEGNYPVVYSNGVSNYHKDWMVKGPGVITGRSGTLGKVHYVEDNYWPHNTALWVTKFDNVDPKFIFYLFNYVGFERFASGSGVPTLNRNDAHDYRVAIPQFQIEQTAIANILSDMDEEIQSLQQRLDKTRQIKQGMMQELLTGKTRLI